jgi:cytochrome b6-f complex iron-sulfur subunit
MSMDKISRNQFLKKLGIGGSALMAVYCGGLLSSCKKDDVTPSGPKDFTLDLDSTSYSSLRTPGNFLVVQEVVIVCTAVNTWVAVTVICSHEGEKKVTYRSSNNDFYCPEHGARYDLNGKGLNSTGSGGLTLYKTSLTGSSLRIFS